MKTINSLLKRVFLSLLVTVLALAIIHAQETNTETSIKTLVETKNYVFKAETAQPLGAPVVYLTSDFDVNVSSDTITTYLPYYGRAYTAPITPDEGGIKFTSTGFEYKAEEKKKGGWNIQIKPRDVRNVQSMTLRISENGNATLQLTSNNRQPISFNGYIMERGRGKNR